MTDRLFADYMLRKQVPYWTRHHARRIYDWHQRDLLDANCQSWNDLGGLRGVVDRMICLIEG